MDEVFDWLMFYNHRRLHSTLGYISLYAVRAKLFCGTIEGCCIMNALRDTEYRGKVRKRVTVRLELLGKTNPIRINRGGVIQAALN